MCFSGEMSGAFAAIGLFLSIWVYTKTNNAQCALGVFYFFLMEFLQYFQYWYINDCDNYTNRFLTLVGFVHICYQPYFCHLLNSALTKSVKLLHIYTAILRLVLIGGTLLCLRHYLAHLPGWTNDHFATINNTDMVNNVALVPGEKLSTEWLRGEELCTISGKYHLAWVIPMADATYYVPGTAIHSFMMFAPFMIVKPGFIPAGFFLWLTGPYMAAWITPNLMEQASIWCFFSISQIGIMLFAVSGMMLGRANDKNEDVPHIQFFGPWPTDVYIPKSSEGKKAK